MPARVEHIVKALQTFISHPWVGYAFAIVILVLQFKMNRVWVNVLRISAWGVLVIVNSSGSLARDIKWIVVLWNMDLPDRDDPLPIPVSTFDWIKPHQEGGPQNLFSGANVAPLLKPGDRLFGSASVNCPNCVRG